MSNPATQTSVLARFVTDGDTARRLFDALMEEARDTPVAAFEEAGAWTVEIYFEHPPDEDAVRTLVGDLAGDAMGKRVAFTTVAARDWVTQSLQGLAPVAAGRFVVHGAHHRHRVPANRIGVEIEAALAFGTGHHGTTRGCLLLLDEVLKAHLPRRVLDLGTGTGVLAIAAAKALRIKVLASDIDPLAVQVTRENARLNGALDLVQAVHATGFSAPEFSRRAPFDLVLANILANPLRQMATPMAEHLAPSALVILSGLLPQQAQSVVAAYRARGLVLKKHLGIEGWSSLLMRRVN
jgi:ribosomal protein L11 methyltransferase